jgi:hypothetical protein
MARRAAQGARRLAKSGDCRRALHYFGTAAFRAGLAQGNRQWLGKRRGSGIGSRILDLQHTIVRLCIR